ncbi:ABC transporter permease (plasmid) [Sinorhizobium medicae]|uniref:ABC transporter permease n=1 Tax=Sinorhizobium medicae TaxID=110321 RepID=UPI002AF6BDB4|nr:ABC transporter permease [Sinorhizobium medicae]WQO62244.1 ABC transporter permease [Sinorhizobium medicae]
MSTIDLQRSNTGVLGRRVSVFCRFVLRNPALAISLAFFAIVIALAVLAPLLPYDPYKLDVLHRNELPTAKHWLGTDELGRDLLARLAVGARVSLIVAVASTIVAIAIGVMIGTISGYVGGMVDSVVMRLVDAMYSFPDMLFAILMAAFVKGYLSGDVQGFWGPLAELYRLSGGILGVLLTLGLSSWPTTSRLVRSQVLSLKHAEYILAARLSGASGWRIIRSHLLPNTIPVILVSVTFVVPNAILLEAGLSFIGIGVDPPMPSWGTMIGEGVKSVQSYPHLLILPALAIGLTLLCLNVIGDALRDILDPTLAGSRNA